MASLDNLRVQALQESTGPLVRTQWPDEQADVAPLQEQDRARYQAWLESSKFPAASNPQIWEAICTNWVSFLSATSSKPKAVLAPCRKVVTWEPAGSESAQGQAQRFKQDRKTRRCVQEAAWLTFDTLEVLAERWPILVRTIINQAGLGTETGPFESWGAKVNLNKRRQGNSIWIGLICFLVHATSDKGVLEEMGLQISASLRDSIMDVAEAEAFHGRPGQSINRDPGPLEHTVEELVVELVTDREATFETNPLVWWIGVLVQSSLQTGADDFISRGRFVSNLLPMDVDARGRLAALLHYSKAVVLHHAMESWQTSPARKMEVAQSLQAVDLEWMNADGDQRPATSADRRECRSEAWTDLVRQVQAQSKECLGGGFTVAKQLRLLLEEG